MPKFFVISGAVLVIAGVAQVLVRPRGDNETAAQKIVNAATMKAVLFVVVGVLGMLVGTGVLPMIHFGP